MRCVICVLAILAVFSAPAAGADTDGDGLLDLIDVEGFDPSESGRVSFQNKGIQDLDGVSLLTHATRLRLHDNLVMDIEIGDFQGLVNLQALYLTNNQISTLESGDFQGLDNLEWLLLESNRITRLESGDFQGLVSLKDLNLYNNEITSIESGAFQNLANLQFLGLAANQITRIESDDFEGLTNLQALGLRDNLITAIGRDDFQQLANLQEINLSGNQITSIDSGDFQELAQLQSIWLSNNQISSIDAGAFQGLANLRKLELLGNRITRVGDGAFDGTTNMESIRLRNNGLTSLNLVRATFQNLLPCWEHELEFEGFCVGNNDIRRIILDDAKLSVKSFVAIAEQTQSITDASLVGVRFTDGNPNDFNSLLSIETLTNITIDEFLYSTYAAELDAFAFQEGHTLIVVAGPCDINRDGLCDILDADLISQAPIYHGPNWERLDLNADMVLNVDDIYHWATSIFGTWIGDVDLDGVFNSTDLITIMAAGRYEADIEAVWSTGDFNGDGHANSADLVAALADGGYEQGRRPVAVPEPSVLAMLLAGLFEVGRVSRTRRKRV